MSTGEWTNHNLFKSIETLTSGDHVECENSSFFPSSSFPPHPQEVQFIPRCMAFSLLWQTAASLPWWATSSPNEGFPPMCSLDERPLPYLNEGPPLSMNNFLSGSPPSTNHLLPEWLVSSCNDWYTNDLWAQQTVSFLDATLSSLLMNCLLLVPSCMLGRLI